MYKTNKVIVSVIFVFIISLNLTYAYNSIDELTNEDINYLVNLINKATGYNKFFIKQGIKKYLKSENLKENVRSFAFQNPAKFEYIILKINKEKPEIYNLLIGLEIINKDFISEPILISEKSIKFVNLDGSKIYSDDKVVANIEKNDLITLNSVSDTVSSINTLKENFNIETNIKTTLKKFDESSEIKIKNYNTVNNDLKIDFFEFALNNKVSIFDRIGSLEIEVENLDLTNSRVIFKVPKSLAERKENIEIKLFKAGNKIEILDATFIKEENNFLIYEGITDSFSTFAVFMVDTIEPGALSFDFDISKIIIFAFVIIIVGVIAITIVNKVKKK